MMVHSPTIRKLSAGWKILIIDDDEDDYIITSESLKEAQGRKIDTEWAPTYEAGRNALLSGPYDAVLVDYDMGEHSGIEIIREASERGCAAPLILYTGRGSYEVDIEAMQAGATLYLTKGETSALMLERAIRYAIEEKQTEQAMALANEQLQKQAEELLEANQMLTYHAGLLSQVQDAVIATDEVWRLTYWNQMAEATFGWSEEEALGKTAPELLQSQFPNLSREQVVKTLLETGHFEGEVMCLSKNGNRTTVIARTATIQGSNGEVIGFVSSMRDVTERKRVEAALQSEQAKLEAVVENLEIGVMIGDAAGLQISMNSAALRLFDFPLSPTILSNPGQFLQSYEIRFLDGRLAQPEDRPAIRAKRGDYFSNLELQVRNLRTGRQWIGSWSASPVRSSQDGIQLLMITVQDITGRKQAEETLMYHASLVENISEAAISTDNQHHILSWNQAAETMYGWRKDEVLGKLTYQVIPTEYLSDMSRDEIIRTLNERGVWSGRTIQSMKDGSKMHVEGSISQLKNTAGQRVGFIAVNRNITEQVQAENELQAAFERTQEVLESITELFYAVDANWRITYLNHRAETIWQRRKEDVLGSVLWDVFPGNEGTVGYQKHFLAMQQRLPVHYQTFSPNFHIWVDTHIYPSLDGGLSIYFRDIDETKQAEAALLESESKYRSLFENSPEAIFLTLPDGSIQAANPAACAMFGWTEAEMMRLGWSGILDTEDPQLAEALEARDQTNRFQVREYTAIRKSGERFPVEVDFAILAGEPRRSFIILRDITERNRAEKALRESEGRERRRAAELEAIIDAVPAYVWITHDRDSHLMVGNRATYDLLRSEPGNNISKSAPEAEVPRQFRAMHNGQEVPPEELPVQMAAQGVQVRNYELDFLFEDGSLVNLVGNASPLYDEQGQPAGAVGAFIDITERKQAEAELKDSESRLRKLVEGNIIGINILNAAGRIKDANTSFSAMIGYSFDELQSDELSLEKLTPPAFWETEQQAIAVAIEHGSCQPYEKAYIHKDGHNIPCLVAYTRLDEKSHDLIGFVVDMTDIVKARTSLQEYAEKLKQSNWELEQFAFVASHDLQEPLRKIKFFGNNLQKQLKGTLNPETLDNLERMIHATERMQAMIQGLLALSQVNTQGHPFEPVDLNAVAAEVVSDLEMRVMRTGGRVVVESLPTIEADPIQIHQVLQNLIGNALKFHQPGVPPQVKVSATVLKPSGKKGEMVSIQVQDQGIGFDEQQFEKMLQPFQRLHGGSDYEGNGIGLAIVKKIIERHHGTMTAHSLPGEGSIFTITLPARHRN